MAIYVATEPLLADQRGGSVLVYNTRARAREAPSTQRTTAVAGRVEAVVVALVEVAVRGSSRIIVAVPAALRSTYPVPGSYQGTQQ